MVLAARGDLAAARAAIRSVPAGVDPAALVAYVASYYDLFWLLDDAQRALLYQLTPGPLRQRPRELGAGAGRARTRSRATTGGRGPTPTRPGPRSRSSSGHAG